MFEYISKMFEYITESFLKHHLAITIKILKYFKYKRIIITERSYKRDK